ncbi:MAG: hypothetical protein ABIR67_00380 [Gaiellaceae bacterium]
MPPLDGAGLAAARDGTDENQQVGPQILEPLRHRDRAVVELLDEYALPELLAREPLDREPAQVEVALVELTNAADEDASQRRRRTC